MKKKLAAIGAIAITSVSFTACASTNNTANTDSSATVSNTPPSYSDVLNAHYNRSKKLCAFYDSLVNQGWTNDEIYNQLNDAGAFDSFYGQGKDIWHALVRWCFANPS